VPRRGGPRASGGDADGGDEAEGKEQTDRHPACEGGMRHEVLHVCEGRSRVLEPSSPRNGGRFTHSGKISAAPGVAQHLERLQGSWLRRAVAPQKRSFESYRGDEKCHLKWHLSYRPGIFGERLPGFGGRLP